ncbi:MAG: orotate phosphoribosyltransferase [Patescibacteria group bacterium]
MKTSLSLSLHKIGAVKFGEFTLKSGMKSPIYIDLRILVSFPELLGQIADEMIALAKPFKFDRIAGIPYTALPIATAISLKTGWPMLYARKEVKDYGTKRKLEGIFNAGETVLLVDDLITTGESKFETIAPFEEVGLKVKDVIVLVDREQGGKRLLEAKGYHLHAVLKIHEMLEVLKKEGKIDGSMVDSVLAFLAANQV